MLLLSAFGCLYSYFRGFVIQSDDTLSLFHKLGGLGSLQFFSSLTAYISTFNRPRFSGWVG